MLDEDFRDKVVTLVTAAGSLAMRYYQTDFKVEEKADNTPVTEADQAVNAFLTGALAGLDPEIPVLSEEMEMPSYEYRRRLAYYWLVDPLDGTREFIKKNGEFTVNVALIEDDQAVFGVVGVPAQGLVYSGGRGLPARVREQDGVERDIHVRAAHDGALKTAVSRSHPNDRLKALLAAVPNHEQVPLGSSLKFCKLADGSLDFYPRFGRLREWDAAAGHALVEAAGGVVTDWDGNPIRYNKKSIIQPAFVAARDADLAAELRATALRVEEI